MAAFAIAQITSISVDSSHDKYIVTVQGQAEDLPNSGSFAVDIDVSTALSAAARETTIREAVAAHVLSDPGVTIDPDDIYFVNPLQ